MQHISRESGDGGRGVRKSDRVFCIEAVQNYHDRDNDASATLASSVTECESCHDYKGLIELSLSHGELVLVQADRLIGVSQVFWERG